MRFYTLYTNHQRHHQVISSDTVTGLLLGEDLGRNAGWSFPSLL